MPSLVRRSLAILSMLALPITLVVLSGGAASAAKTTSTVKATSHRQVDQPGHGLADLYRASRHRLHLARLRPAHRPVPDTVHGGPARFVACGGGRREERGDREEASRSRGRDGRAARHAGSGLQERSR